MKTKELGFFFWMLFMIPSTPVRGDLFQWVDPRGVIHFTDNLHSVPEPLRGSRHLLVRGDLDKDVGCAGTSTLPETAREEPAIGPKAPEVVSPPEPEPSKVTPATFHYNPQHFTIVVVNSIVRHPKGRPCLIPEGCNPSAVFRPNFDDRRYIHPSVFNGGSHQYVQPELFRPARR